MRIVHITSNPHCFYLPINPCEPGARLSKEEKIALRKKYNELGIGKLRFPTKEDALKAQPALEEKLGFVIAYRQVFGGFVL